MNRGFIYFILICFPLSILAQPGNWLKGYTEDVKGEILTYHAPHPEVTTSLLIRNQDSAKYISWKMEKVPENSGRNLFTFVWMFGIDVNEKTYTYRLYLNDQYLLSFRNPSDTLIRKWIIRGKEGVELEFNASLVDKYGDLMGYAFLTVPSKLLNEGERPEVKITATSSGDPCWYMTHRYAMNSNLLVKQMQAIMNTPEGESYVLRFDIHHFGESTTATLNAGGRSMEIPVEMGVNYTYFPVPGKSGDHIEDISVEIDGEVSVIHSITLSPVHPITLYLLHHSHSDIGYTHHQHEVEKMHHGFFGEAVDLFDMTKEYPEGSRFKWNVEVCWAVESYLEQCSPEQKQDFIRAVQQGGIGLDALWANQLTGICSPEELIQLVQRSSMIAEECGVLLRSAMITDIPGYTWSLVPVLAKSGIRYFSPGTNVFHRIGDIKDTWGDKPFYWVSKSGQDSILTWFPARGYSWFHTGLGSGEPRNLLTEEPIFEYLDDLKNNLYPYDMSIIRYNIGSDNGPPHKALPDIVRNWNEKYLTPRLHIATTAEAFALFEEKYASELPSFAGDLSPYWEDGAASSARETAMVNQAAERLEQALTLWVLSGNRDYPYSRIDEAWKNILFFDEHTWGSWNSISAPHDPFTLNQWKTKQSFALSADSITKVLFDEAMSLHAGPGSKEMAFDIWNTHSWPVTDIVTIPLPPNAGNIYVTDVNNTRLKTQYLSDGNLCVLVRDVPPFAASRIIIHEEQNLPHPIPPELQFNMTINEHTGAITQLSYNRFDWNFVDTSSGYGLNDYIYVDGRDPSVRRYAENIKVSRTESGPLVNTFRLESKAPGADKLIREISIINNLDRIDIRNTIDKSEVYEPEGVHFAFPFNIPKGKVRVNLAWDYYLAGVEQLPGSNFNYNTLSRWVDISNAEMGVLLVSPEAPLIEIGEISMDVLSYGEKDGQDPGQTIYSYVMNNYWETNYRAAQEGEVVFRYSLIPHEGFDPVFNMKKALERTQPLQVVPAPADKKHFHSLIHTDNQEVIVTGLIPAEEEGSFLLRLYNPTAENQEVNLSWSPESTLAVSFSSCGLSGEDPVPLSGRIVIKAHDFQTLRVEF
ncbi:MAG: hypothetical protein V2I47_03575 [Bacteroidales bacterium]|jgi:hypothetical protein|nr:hypothetical protein [Bacteroidales bacterium]